MARSSRCTAGLLVALALLPPAAQSQVRLVPVDTVWLEEREGTYLVLPNGLHVDLDGYLVTDADQARVFRYAANGRLVRRYGSKGDGPGEFRTAIVALPYGADEILVVTVKPPALHRFNRRTGAFVRRYPLQSLAASALLSGDTIWLGGPQYGPRAGVERVRIGRSDSAFLAPLPQSFQYGGPVGGIFPRVSMTRWKDSLLVGFESNDTLLVLAPNGRVVERVTIPHQRRRGIPSDLQAHLLVAMRKDYTKVFGVLSALRGMYRLPSGATALVHYDSRPGKLPASSDVFLSVVSADRTRACVDASVPLGPDPHPVIAFKADTLLVLDQQLRDGLDVATFIARFTVDTSTCRWVRTGIAGH
jgi:hypothetical protein